MYVYMYEEKGQGKFKDQCHAIQGKGESWLIWSTVGWLLLERIVIRMHQLFIFQLNETSISFYLTYKKNCMYRNFI